MHRLLLSMITTSTEAPLITGLVFRSTTDMQQCGMDDILVGEDVLERFTLTLASLFAL